MAESHGTASPDENAEGIAMPSEIMFGMGWLRFLPQGSPMAFAAVSFYGQPTLAQIAKFADVGDTGLGADIPVWDEPRAWTEEGLRELRKDCPPGPGEPTTVAETSAEEAEQAARIAEIDSYAAGLGLPPIRTLANMIDYMTACRLLLTASVDGVTRYRLNPAPSLPGEVLTLAENVHAEEDRMRWEDLHEPIAQRIIALFTSPEAGHPNSMRTTLQRLARELDLDVETTRGGLTTLIGDGDFTTTRDPESVAEHQVFEIHVDWETFAAIRISVSFGTRDD